ncbi:hypothetical protein CAL7716_041040 [Calothrix sp. PCC 7716]|nr:hypothetical protein CAL7716_041040 [Calothrix sp. PCC 7716]
MGKRGFHIDFLDSNEVVMPFTLNGCRTKYYGRRDMAPDGSYVTTEWIQPGKGEILNIYLIYFVFI